MTTKLESPPSNSDSHLSRPIVLIGLMGCGKSSIGRRLAKSLKVPFVDSDVAIVEAAGCSISDFFEIYGEEMFRDLEKRVLKRLLSDEAPSVIATGGGAFIQPEIREMIQEKSFSIWLKADIETLFERVSRKKTRPLLEKGNKREILENLLAEREPIYSQAHITVCSDHGAHENVVRRALDAMSPYFPNLISVDINDNDA